MLLPIILRTHDHISEISGRLFRLQSTAGSLLQGCASHSYQLERLEGSQAKEVVDQTDIPGKIHFNRLVDM